MENDIHSKSNIFKKAIKLVFKILYQILIVLCFILILIIVLQKVTNSNGSIAGYRIFRVITGSMIPQYDIGEVVISKKINPNKIKVGDDIVYMGTYGEYNGKIIMHEVVGIDKDENGNLNFHAKGLNTNSIEDPQIKADQIYGVVKLKAGVLTVLYDLATNIYTAFVIITILAFNVFVSFSLPEKIKKKQLKEASEEFEEDEDDEEYDEDYDEDDDENEEYEEDEEETEEESDSDDEE